MNKVKFFVTAAFMMVMCVVSNAQTAGQVKIGYTNTDYILSLMPESKRIESDLKTYSSQLEAQLQTMAADFEAKGKDYQQKGPTMTEVIRAAKEKELMNARSAIEEFQKNAEVSLQKKQNTLLEPAYKKMQKAIEDVVKENGYTYVLNSEAIIHASEEGNISDLILKKMGITPPAKTTASNTPSATPATTPAKTTPLTPVKKK